MKFITLVGTNRKISIPKNLKVEEGDAIEVTIRKGRIVFTEKELEREEKIIERIDDAIIEEPEYEVK